MNRFRKKIKSKIKRKMSIRKTVRGDGSKPRVTVFRSNKHITAQIIDDVSSKTLMSHTDIGVKTKKGTKTETAMSIGEELGKKAVKSKIETVVFDRNGYKYHGRVKALAEGLRKAGLKF